VSLSPKPLHPGFASVLGGPRGALRGPPLHPLEAALLAVTALHLCFLPWALGAMHVWSQLTSLGLSVVGLVLASMPRTGSGGVAGSPAARLVRFPVFWAGLAVLCYIALQGLNPAWRFESNATSWWLKPLAHDAMLPTGVDAPYSRSNPWRALTIFGSMWLLVCSVWAGFSRRQSYRVLFTVLVVNALLLAGLGVLEQLTVAKEIFWVYRPRGDMFAASFIYRNHAGCYFNLMVALAAGLAWWHYRRARRAIESPGPAVALAFSAVFLGVMVIFSYSRMSILMLLAFSALVSLALIFGPMLRKGPAREHRDFLPPLVAIAGFLCVGLVTLRAEGVWQRFAGIVSDPKASDHGRSLVRQAATKMLRDRWLFGWGAGCFRYGFPIYAQGYPEIYYSGANNRFYWEHAHDDILEFPIELGVAGMLPLVAAFAYLAWQLARRRFWRNSVSLCAGLGCALVVAHSWVDFVFQNPAVLLTWGVLLAGAVRWADLDQSDARRIPAAAAVPAHGPEPGAARSAESGLDG